MTRRRTRKLVSEAVGRGLPPSQGTEVAALTPDEVCKRDEDRLARLRSSPSSDEAQRFANELGCEKLRPQVLGLMASLAHAAPAPAAADVSNGASPGAQAVREAAPASPLAGTDVAALTPDEVCKRDGDRLARLRGSPSAEEAQRFASELACEKLRPQLQHLMESLGVAPARRQQIRLLRTVCSRGSARASGSRLIACGRSLLRRRPACSGATCSANGCGPRFACSWKASTSRQNRWVRRLRRARRGGMRAPNPTRGPPTGRTRSLAARRRRSSTESERRPTSATPNASQAS